MDKKQLRENQVPYNFTRFFVNKGY